MRLSPAQLDRACGAVLGTAVGDALGAPYEFGLATVGTRRSPHDRRRPRRLRPRRMDR